MFPPLHGVEGINTKKTAQLNYSTNLQDIFQFIISFSIKVPLSPLCAPRAARQQGIPMQFK